MTGIVNGRSVRDWTESMLEVKQHKSKYFVLFV